MSRRTLQVRSRLPVPAAELFAWHTRPGAFERLSPPWDRPRVVSEAGGVRDGARVKLALSVAGLPVSWELEHVGYRDGDEFRDRQVSGPFAFWEHTHRVIADGPDASIMEDVVEYELPGGAVGDALGQGLVSGKLLPLFAFRHRQLRRDLDRHRRFRQRGPMTVAITGASGMIGRALAAFLGTGGHRVLRFVRPDGHPGGRDAIAWDPARGVLDPGALAEVDAVVNLAGESVAGGRWSDARKRRILESRVKATTLVAEALAAAPPRPRALVSASAIGLYGAHGDEALDESTPAGQDFLAQVVVAWEAAAQPARASGLRVAHPRIGNVLDPGGGMLDKLLPIFRKGAGGRVGSGTQTMSWIALDDVVGAIHRALCDDTVSDAFNVTTPEAVSNAELTRALGQVLGRPTLLPVPAFAVKAAFGEMGEVLLLSGMRAVPARLEAWGFPFLHPRLEPALADMLGKSDVPAPGGTDEHLTLDL